MKTDIKEIASKLTPDIWRLETNATQVRNGVGHHAGLQHPAGRAITSDWFVNSSIMDVYENFLAVLWTENFGWSLKKFSWATIKNCLWTRQKWVLFLYGGQDVGRCCTRSDHQESITRNHASEGIHLGFETHRRRHQKSKKEDR